MTGKDVKTLKTDVGRVVKFRRDLHPWRLLPRFRGLLGEVLQEEGTRRLVKVGSKQVWTERKYLMFRIEKTEEALDNTEETC